MKRILAGIVVLICGAMLYVAVSIMERVGQMFEVKE